MLVVGRRVIPWILHYVAHTGSRELFRLAVLAIALGVAFGAAELFGVSLRARRLLRRHDHERIRAQPPRRGGIAAAARRLRGAVLRLGRHAVRSRRSCSTTAWPILATLFIIVVGKSVAAFVIVLAFRYPVATALTISASLAQIGEFSFILAELGVGLEPAARAGPRPDPCRRDPVDRAQPADLRCRRLAATSARKRAPARRRRSTRRRARTRSRQPAVRPAKQTSARPGQRLPAIRSWSAMAASAAWSADAEGRAISRSWSSRTPTSARELRDEGISRPSSAMPPADVFAAANPRRAQRLILAIPNAFEAGQIVQRARAANPGIRIIARAHSDAEVEHLTGLGADPIIMGEREIARGIIHQLFAWQGRGAAAG